MKAERRRYKRVRTAVFYRILRNSTPRQQVKNLSEGGVRIYSDERLDVGQVLELEFFLPKGVLVEAVARVVWIIRQQPGSEGVYDVGMEFVNLPQPARRELAAVLENG